MKVLLVDILFTSPVTFTLTLKPWNNLIALECLPEVGGEARSQLKLVACHNRASLTEASLVSGGWMQNKSRHVKDLEKMEVTVDHRG